MGLQDPMVAPESALDHRFLRHRCATFSARVPYARAHVRRCYSWGHTWSVSWVRFWAAGAATRSLARLSARSLLDGAPVLFGAGGALLPARSRRVVSSGLAGSEGMQRPQPSYSKSAFASFAESHPGSTSHHPSGPHPFCRRGSQTRGLVTSREARLHSRTSTRCYRRSQRGTRSRQWWQGTGQRQ